jgi:hypothetical protein
LKDSENVAQVEAEIKKHQEIHEKRQNLVKEKKAVLFSGTKKEVNVVQKLATDAMARGKVEFDTDFEIFDLLSDKKENIEKMIDPTIKDSIAKIG